MCSCKIGYMKNKFLRKLIILFLIIFVTGCVKVAEKSPVSENIEEEVVDTGVLDIKSSPSQAEIYVDGEFKGNTPFTLYNFPVGTYNVVVKKDDYTDFEREVTVKVGKTEEIDATLKPIIIEEKKPEKLEEELPKNISIPKLNKINLSSFAMYYDFDKMQFWEIRTSESDLFSRKYDTYVHFTALIPTKISVIGKPINDVKKEDCIFSDIAVTPVFSGQTLCVKTGTGTVIAIGAVWEKMPDELEWKLLS